MMADEPMPPPAPKDPRIWVQPEFKRGRHFNMDDFALVVVGEVYLPNAKPHDPIRFLSDLAARGHMMEPKWGYSLRPDTNHRQWTQFFMLGHIYEGTGYAVISAASAPIVMKFALCEHEKVSMGGGGSYHPGYCSKCGMDMSVDSSG
jgi:hypothetical protein